MKKIILITLLLLVSPLYAATDAQLLKDKLAKFKLLNAQFTQLVTSADGDVLNKSQGTLSIARPGKFRWQVVTPEEDLIISDGKTLWMYSPFIEQVTLMNLNDAVADTPFVLLSGADAQQWQKYLVSRDNNNFIIKSVNSHEQTNSFVFEFDKQDNIQGFAVIEPQGQRSEFSLTNKPVAGEFSPDYFTFQIPEGVEVDDQR